MDDLPEIEPDAPLVLVTSQSTPTATDSDCWPEMFAPALMTYFLVHVTGARLTEKYMRGRPGFSEYKQRTSFFIPRPPRSARS